MNIGVALKQSFLFKDFPEAELLRLAAIAKQEHFAAESTLFYQGEPGDKFYLIVLGSVSVRQSRDNNPAEELVTLGSGQYFGEMAIIDDAHERSATIVTKEDTHLITLSRTEVQKILEHDDRLAHHFYRALARGLTRRLRSTTRDAAFFRALAKHRHD